MKQGLLAILLAMITLPASAGGLSAQDASCLSQIRDEADFIVSRINLIHHDYEQQVEHSALGHFKSGEYSTIKLLDNTIRKYHRRLVRQIRDYPFRYEVGIKSGRHGRHTRCLAQQLRDESVGTIHEFELSWQQALHQARKNARYFKQLDDMN